MKRLMSKMLKFRRLLLRQILKVIARSDYKAKSEYWPWVRLEESGDAHQYTLFSFSKELKKLSLIVGMDVVNRDFIIVGSGPSIREVNFSSLEEHRNVILLNGAISLISQHKIRPFCCVVIDSTFIENRFDIIEGLPTGTRLLTTLGCLRAIHERNTGLIKRLDIYLTQEITNPIYEVDANVQENAILDGFSDDVGIGYVDGGTVMAVAIQLVFQLSAANVFLLGFDIGNANLPRFNETSLQRLKSGLINDYEQKILPFMYHVKEKSLCRGVAVYNCSPITKLPYDITPYIDVSTLYYK
ncbi:MAG: hypothetical protein ACRC1W_06360 [Shewanella sp.]